MNRLILWIRNRLKHKQHVSIKSDCSASSKASEHHNDKKLFDELDDKIATYNTEKQFDIYWNQYQDIYKMILGLEQKGAIAIKSSKHISYLQEILENDGPEYCFVIEFWAVYNNQRRYKIGVCVRGRPLVEKI